MRRALLALASAIGFASPALADPLVVTKTATVLTDRLGYTVTPRSLPGAVVEYKVVYLNPLSNALRTVRNIVTEDMLPPNVVLYVRDLAAAGKGPVEFSDGNLLGTGLAASGLSYSFVSLASATDGIEFYNGSVWTYTPAPDAHGYDPNVRGFRIATTSNFVAATQFQIRYRVKIR